jgi:hypothetical protein
VTLLNNHSAIESALVTSANFNVNQPTVNPESVTAQSTGVYVLHLSYTASEANFLLSLASNSGCQVGFGIGYCQAQTSGKAWLEGVSVVGDPNAKISITPSSVAAPEIDSNSAIAALTLLLGGLAVLRGRQGGARGAMTSLIR